MMLKPLTALFLTFTVVIGAKICGKNEIFSSCGKSAEKNCYERDPIVDRMCHLDCICIEDHVRHNGTCIPTAECKNHCGANEEFLETGNLCEAPCHNPQRKPCKTTVKNVCRCKAGFVRDFDGVCKRPADCLEYDVDN